MDLCALDSDIGDAFVLRPKAAQGTGASQGAQEEVSELRVPSKKLVNP